MLRISQNEIPEGLFKVMRQVQDYIRSSGIDPLLIELLDTRVSQMNGCAYCLDMHSKEAIHKGETLQRLISLSVWRETDYYTAKERVVLDFAERLTNLQEEKESDDLHDDLKKYFSNAEIANLSLAIAQINSWNRLVKSFGTIAGTYGVK
jgi:AhpD family alkylhydroperoxidase|nr:carboxymuconolactone decarboxylase family protein [Pedobacter panaciterrae]